MHAFCLTSVLATSSALTAADGVAPAAPNAVPAEQHVNNTPPVPPTPAPIIELIEARPFTLATSYTQEWRKDSQPIGAGYVIVVRVPNDYLYPRQLAQPVLFVGSTVAELMNVGYESGIVVAVVPSTRNEAGALELDLTKSPIYFGQPMLPETVDAAIAQQQLQLATRAGISAMSAAAVDAANEKSGTDGPVALVDREALDRLAGSLVRTYAAGETKRADELEGKLGHGKDAEPVIVKP